MRPKVKFCLQEKTVCNQSQQSAPTSKEFQIDAWPDGTLNSSTMNWIPARPTLVLAAILALGTIFPGSVAAQKVVSIDAAGFQPNSWTIGVGDSILWFNLDPNSAHTTTSDRPVGDPDFWNVSLNYTAFYTRTFPRAGTFTYHDNVSGFIGTIIVYAPALSAPRKVNNQFVFEVTGLTVGRTNLLQFSTNLTTWTTFQTNTAAASTATFSNAVSGNRKFYRLVEMR